jgi:hypothetical protein
MTAARGGSDSSLRVFLLWRAASPVVGPQRLDGLGLLDCLSGGGAFALRLSFVPGLRRGCHRRPRCVLKGRRCVGFHASTVRTTGRSVSSCPSRNRSTGILPVRIGRMRPSPASGGPAEGPRLTVVDTRARDRARVRRGLNDRRRSRRQRALRAARWGRPGVGPGCADPLRTR